MKTATARTIALVSIVSLSSLASATSRADDRVPATAPPEERTTIGVAVGTQGLSDGMLGGAPEIIDKLGLRHGDRATIRVVPQIAADFDIHTEPGWKVGLGLRASWFADSIAATDSTATVRIAARRDVIPVSALLRWTTVNRFNSAHFVLAVGPTLAVSRFTESGWLGDGTETKPALGVLATTGVRVEVSKSFEMSFLLFLHELRLPQKNPLLADGGSTWMLGFNIGVDIGL